MNILSPGEKIKRLRREIGLKQDELTDDQITRSLISMIENGKRSLSHETAKIIAKKLNDHYKRYGKKITANYLMESKEEQVQKIIDNQLVSINILLSNYKNLNHSQIYDIFNKMLSLANEWSIREHYSKTLLRRGEFNYSSANYSDALMDFFSSLDYYLETKNFEVVSLIYSKIGSSFLSKHFVEEGLLYFNKAYSVALENNTPNLQYIKMLKLYNTIICHRNLKKFDLVFKNISLFRELESVDSKYYDDVLLMEANTYRDLSNYDKAKKIYEELLSRESELSSNTLLMIYNNLSILYRCIGNLKESIKYSNQATELAETVDLNISPTIYCDIAKCYRNLNQLDKAIETLYKGSKIAKETSNIEALISINLFLSEIYKDHYNNLEEAEKRLLSIEEALKELGVKSKSVEVYSRIAKFYCQINKPERCMIYLDKIHA